jgi:hypothetical protein
MVATRLLAIGTKTLPFGSFIPGFAAIRSATLIPVRFEMVCQLSPFCVVARFEELIFVALARLKTATTSFAFPGGTFITYGSGGVVLLRRCGLR